MEYRKRRLGAREGERKDNHERGGEVRDNHERGEGKGNHKRGGSEGQS